MVIKGTKSQEKGESVKIQIFGVEKNGDTNI